MFFFLLRFYSLIVFISIVFSSAILVRPGRSMPLSNFEIDIDDDNVDEEIMLRRHRRDTNTENDKVSA